MHRAGCLVKSRSLADDVVAVMQARRSAREQGAETLLALDQWALAQILAVEVEEIEQEEDQRRRVAAVRRGKDAPPPKNVQAASGIL